MFTLNTEISIKKLSYFLGISIIVVFAIFFFLYQKEDTDTNFLNYVKIFEIDKAMCTVSDFDIGEDRIYKNKEFQFQFIYPENIIICERPQRESGFPALELSFISKDIFYGNPTEKQVREMSENFLSLHVNDAVPIYDFFIPEIAEKFPDIQLKNTLATHVSLRSKLCRREKKEDCETERIITFKNKNDVFTFTGPNILDVVFKSFEFIETK